MATTVLMYDVIWLDSMQTFLLYLNARDNKKPILIHKKFVV